MTALDLDALLPDLLRRVGDDLPQVVGVWLFGSHATGHARADSDIDLAVLGASVYDPVRVFDLGLELGVVARRDVDLVDLRRAPLTLRKEILIGGRRVMCADEAACRRFVADSMALYVAFQDELKLALAEARRR